MIARLEEASGWKKLKFFLRWSLSLAPTLWIFLKKKNFFRLAMFNPNRVIVWAKGSCFVAWARNPAP